MLVHTKLCHTARFGHPEWRQTLTLATRFLSSNQGSYSWCSAVRDTEGVCAACDRKQNRAGWQRKQSSFLHLSIILLCWLALVFGTLVAGFSHTTPPPSTRSGLSPLSWPPLFWTRASPLLGFSPDVRCNPIQPDFSHVAAKAQYNLQEVIKSHVSGCACCFGNPRPPLWLFFLTWPHW